MVKRNSHLSKLSAGYLFPEINRRKQAFLKQNPHAKLISLGIGDTTYPLSSTVTDLLQKYVKGLSTFEGYSGYGPEQGILELRQAIADKLYQRKISADEVFISDGAKCDIARMQLLFGTEARVAVQNPTYPVYVDTSVMIGRTGSFHAETKEYEGIIYLPCMPENDFFPDLNSISRPDVLYFCSPNNPTGSVATRAQLQQLVNYAKANKVIIVFDSAYASYIQDPDLPRSIYEIPGAKEVAIEISSFSKMAGFTGVRLGWTVIPDELKFETGESVKKDWDRIQATCFNGASNISQQGGLAVLYNDHVIQEMIQIYMENARIIRQACLELGFPTYGGVHAPYVWVKFPQKSSWDAFEELLCHAQVVTTPGEGFGSGGQGFLRMSCFGPQDQVKEAVKRMQNLFIPCAN